RLIAYSTPQAVQPMGSTSTYEIANSNLKLNKATLGYWRGLAIPVYLFAISEDPDNKQLAAYYKRYTPTLITKSSNVHIDYRSDYYKVSRDYQFLAFADSHAKSHGFARDLFIDYMRCTYSKGSIMYLNPRALGLNQFPESRNIFPELFEDYKEEIGNTYTMLKSYIEHLGSTDAKNLSDISAGFSAQFTAAEDLSIKKL
ncbi:MAG: hypothetical protein KQI81_24435, partial [Deltaproteobacteria bacterium]|nr:hypothetical protein [Deltaproteobacteria bacterium]